jgi:hypothetical protein
MTTPVRIPAWAAAEPQPASNRLEPGGASTGYALAAIPTHSDINWLFWSYGVWLRFLQSFYMRCSDVWATNPAQVYRLSRTALAWQVGGPLSQFPSQSAVYLWGGQRLAVYASQSVAQVFAPATTNYVHLRAQPSETSRDPQPEILVSTNSSEVGYATVSVVVTGAATISSVTEATVVDGYRVLAPADHRAPVEITPSTGGGAALAIAYRNSGIAPGVTIAPQVGALQTALSVQAPSANRAILANGTSSDNILEVSQAGVGRALYATKSGASGIVAEVEAVGAAGIALQVTASAGADGIEIDSTAGGGNPLVVEPSALGPTVPRNGSIYPLLGLGYAAWRFREGGKSYIIHASQDGPLPQRVLNTSTSTLNGGSGTTTIQTISAYFRNGGTYRIEWDVVHGRTFGSTAQCAYTCRIGGAAQSGANALNFAIPDPGAVAAGTYFVGTFRYFTLYVHGGADGFVTVDFQVTMTAGTNAHTFTNRSISIETIYA